MNGGPIAAGRVRKTRERATDAGKSPLCEALNPSKHDRNGNPYSTLSCAGSDSNIFLRTPFGREYFEKWKKAARDDTVSASARHEELKEREEEERISRLFEELGMDRLL